MNYWSCGAVVGHTVGGSKLERIKESNHSMIGCEQQEWRLGCRRLKMCLSLITYNLQKFCKHYYI